MRIFWTRFEVNMLFLFAWIYFCSSSGHASEILCIYPFCLFVPVKESQIFEGISPADFQLKCLFAWHGCANTRHCSVCPLKTTLSMLLYSYWPLTAFAYNLVCLTFWLSFFLFFIPYASFLDQSRIYNFNTRHPRWYADTKVYFTLINHTVLTNT